MLNIYFGSREDEIRYASPYFDAYMELDWLEDELNKEMIKDVDKSTVINGNSIESPLLGIIPPQWLSGGVKALICMNSDDRGFIFNGTNCGDNCAKWILKIAEEKDLTITLHHLLAFEYKDTKIDNFKIKIANTGELITDYETYVKRFWDWQVKVRDKKIDIFGNPL